MSWVKAILKAAADAVTGMVKRVARFFWDSCRRAMKRTWLLPVAVCLTVGAVWLSPLFAVTLGVIMVNDPEAHPIVKMLLDIGAGLALVGIVLLVPELAIALALLPVADLLNRFVDLVLFHKEEMEPEERTTSCQELWEQQPCGAELSASPC